MYTAIDYDNNILYEDINIDIVVENANKITSNYTLVFKDANGELIPLSSIA